MGAASASVSGRMRRSVRRPWRPTLRPGTLRVAATVGGGALSVGWTRWLGEGWEAVAVLLVVPLVLLGLGVVVLAVLLPALVVAAVGVLAAVGVVLLPAILLVVAILAGLYVLFRVVAHAVGLL